MQSPQSLFGVRRLRELREVLLDPKASGPDEAYYMLRVNPNISVWPPAMYGREYNKSVGHYHKHEEPETYWVLYGKAVFVLQKRNADNTVTAVRLVRLKAGDRIRITGAWGHAMVNVGTTALVTRDDAPGDASHTQNDYEPIRRRRGMAYYIIRGGNGKPDAVPNPKYKNLPKPVWE